MPRYRLYVGPAYVHQYAVEIEAAGYDNVVEGTEHILFESAADLYAVAIKLYDVIGYLPALHHLQVITPKTGEIA